MQVKCVDAQGARGITVGQKYTVRPADHPFYWKIKNDNGGVKCYHKGRFEPLSVHKED